MSSEEIMRIYCKNTPFLPKEVQKELIRKAKEEDSKHEAASLKKIFNLMRHSQRACRHDGRLTTQSLKRGSSISEQNKK